MRRSVQQRGGFALTEAIVAATLLLMLVQVSWWVTAVQSVVGMRVVTGARILDETRLIHHVITAEVGQGSGGVDWIVDNGELHLRAFRGTAFRCHMQPDTGAGGGRLWVPGAGSGQGFGSGSLPRRRMEVCRAGEAVPPRRSRVSGTGGF